MFRVTCLLSLAIIFAAELVLALPQWDGGWGTQPQSAIGSLVPGSSFIEAIMDGVDTKVYRPKYLSIPTEKGKRQSC